MDESGIALMERPRQSPPPNMMWVPSGTFRMGSDKHYQEEAPSHRVSVDGFWIDRTPVIRWNIAASLRGQFVVRLIAGVSGSLYRFRYLSEVVARRRLHRRELLERTTRPPQKITRWD
jgi:hypothetical protein